MTTVRRTRNVREASAFSLWQDSLPRPAPGRLAVVMRKGECTDLLVLSDGEEGARLLLNVGDHISDALGALSRCGLLPDTSAIMVIHHLAADRLASSQEERREECSADSGWLRSLSGHELQRSVREDVAFLRASPLIFQHIEVSGLIHDVSSGQLFLVTASPSDLTDLINIGEGTAQLLIHIQDDC